MKKIEYPAKRTRRWKPWDDEPLFKSPRKQFRNAERKWLHTTMYCSLYLFISVSSFLLTVQENTVKKLYDTTTEQISANVSYFLLANSVATFFEPWMMSRLGMRRTVLIGASLNVVGCFMRSGLGWTIPWRTFDWSTEVAGTILIGLAQGIIQCPIAELAARWFTPDVQTYITAFVMSFDNFGVGLSFIAPGLFFHTVVGLPKLMFMVSVVSFFNWVAFLLYFESSPPLGYNEEFDIKTEEDGGIGAGDFAIAHSSESDFSLYSSGKKGPSLMSFWQEGWGLMKESGFWQLTVIFVCSACIQNSISSYLATTMTTDLDSNDITVAIAGFSFWSGNTAMALVVGPIVDRLKVTNPKLAYIGAIHFFSVTTLACMGGMILALVFETKNASGSPVISRVTYMLCAVIAGNFISIVQPLANDAGLACIAKRRRGVVMDDENLVLSIMQLIANTCSSFFVDILAINETLMSPAYLFVYVGTTASAFVMYCLFATFDGPLYVKVMNSSEVPVAEHSIVPNTGGDMGTAVGEGSQEKDTLLASHRSERGE